MDGRRTTAIAITLLATAGPVTADAPHSGIWRNVIDGQVEYSDRFSHGAEPYPHPLPPILRTVRQVIDGDTVRLTTGQRVRLAGLNAPELHDRRRPAEPGAREARQFLQRMVESHTVRLRLEQPPRDRYGRIRAHLLLDDGRNVNETLLANGHAHLDLRETVPQYLNQYQAAENRARTREIGIWRLPEYQPMPGHQAIGQIHGYRFFRDRIESRSRCGAGLCILLAGGLELRIETADHRRRFPDRLLARLIAGREVLVRGWVRSDHGTPWIGLIHPFQVTLTSPDRTTTVRKH